MVEFCPGGPGGGSTGETPALLSGPKSHLCDNFMQTSRFLRIFWCAVNFLRLGGQHGWVGHWPTHHNSCPNRAHNCISMVQTGELYQLLFRFVDTGGEGRVGHWPCRWKGGGLATGLPSAPTKATGLQTRLGWPLAFPPPPPRPLASQLVWGGVGHWPPPPCPYPGHWPCTWGGGGLAISV